MLGDGLVAAGRFLKKSSSGEAGPPPAGSSFPGPCSNNITHTFIHVLDQEKALDFYVGKLGMVVNPDADLGFMRWFTVNVPGSPNSRSG